MDEAINVQTVSNTPENSFLNEPEYILKKKFCFAVIPVIISICINTFSGFASFIMFIAELFIYGQSLSINEIIYKLLGGTSTVIMIVALIFLCVLLFKKVTKPLLSIPFFIAVLSRAISLIISLIPILNTNHRQHTTASIFDMVSMFDFSRQEIYFYSGIISIEDYMFQKFFWIICVASWILSFSVFGICILKATLNPEKSSLVIMYFPAVVYPVFLVIFALFWGENLSISAGVFSLGVLTISALSVFVPEYAMLSSLFKWIANPYKLVPAPEVETPTDEETSAVKEETEKAKETIPETIKPECVEPAVAPVTPQVPTNQDSVKTQKDNIELIKQYKELLDLGAISQEDYEKKKNNLLDV